MKIIAKHLLSISALTLALSACSSLFDKDNTPPPAKLTNFTAAAKIQPVWFTSTGSGADSEYLKLSPAISGQTIFSASKNGVVTANDKNTGKSLWSTNTHAAISGGTAAYDNLVFIGTHSGELIALHQADGSLAWKTPVASEILAPVATKDGITLAKTIDGQVTAFTNENGHTLWHYQATEPSLILRGASAPQITGNSAIVGFENGKLIKFNLRSGSESWQDTIAEPEGVFAISRMVDIDADPIVIGDRVYAATYQGRIAALELGSGQERWNHDISSYSGIASDGERVFVSDAQSHIFAFNAGSGSITWEQKQLEARNITGPAVLGNYVIVGDAEGYLHILNKQDGRFIARTFVNSSGILATPLVNNNIVYVYTKDGHLAAYTVS